MTGDPVIGTPSDMTVVHLFDCNKPLAYSPERGAVVTVALLIVNRIVHERTRVERSVTSTIYIADVDVTDVVKLNMVK